MTASERIREARKTKACPFCGSTQAEKFDGTAICADKDACIKRIGRKYD